MGWQTRFSADGRKAEGFVNDAASVHAYDGMARLANDGFAPSDSDMQLLGDVDLLG